MTWMRAYALEGAPSQNGGFGKIYRRNLSKIRRSALVRTALHYQVLLVLLYLIDIVQENHLPEGVCASVLACVLLLGYAGCDTGIPSQVCPLSTFYLLLTCVGCSETENYSFIPFQRDGRLSLGSCLALKPLESRLRCVFQVIRTRSQYLCPGNYRPYQGYSRQCHYIIRYDASTQFACSIYGGVAWPRPSTKTHERFFFDTPLFSVLSPRRGVYQNQVEKHFFFFFF